MAKLTLQVFAYVIVVLIAASFAGNSSAQTPAPENYQEIERLNALIKNPDCRLPCWWDLTLGESTLEDLEELALANFGEEFAVGPDDDYIHAGRFFIDSTPDAPYWRLFTGIGLWFRQSDEKLAAIGFSTGYPPGSYVNYLPYLPYGILSTYGQPDEATITFFNPEGGYDITLKYHDLRLYVYYDMFFPDPSAINPEKGIPICNNNITSMRLWVESNLKEYSTGMREDLWDTFKIRLDIEEDIAGVSNLSIAAFTDLFSQPDTCFQTLPIDEWVKFAPTPSTE